MKTAATDCPPAPPLRAAQPEAHTGLLRSYGGVVSLSPLNHAESRWFLGARCFVGEAADEPLPACEDRPMVGHVELTKGMQKMIFLLQAAGCPLDAEYDLHNYGPYSQDVAQLADELTRASLLAEEVETHPQGE